MSDFDCHPNPSDPYRIIDVEEGWIVAYWAENLGVSRECIVKTVAAVGCHVADVKRAIAGSGQT